MAYSLHFFAKAGEETGQTASDRILNAALISGRPVLGERFGPFVDEVAAYGSPRPTSTGQLQPTG